MGAAINNESTTGGWGLDAFSWYMYQIIILDFVVVKHNSESDLFDTQMVLLKEFFEKIEFAKKISRRQKSMKKFSVIKELMVIGLLMCVVTTITLWYRPTL